MARKNPIITALEADLKAVTIDLTLLQSRKADIEANLKRFQSLIKKRRPKNNVTNQTPELPESNK